MARILVTDDEHGIRSLLDRLLSGEGYDVVLADGGRKGMELFRWEPPHAVVLDLVMPEMNGIAVLQQIRRIDQKPPVIILIWTRILEMKQKAYAVGVTEFVEKEFSMHLLLDALKRPLNAAGTAT